MKKNTNSSSFLFGLMVLVFWLAILFFDGAFSFRNTNTHKHDPISTTTLSHDNTSTSGEFLEQHFVAETKHTSGSIDETIDATISHITQNSNTYLDTFKDLKTLEYIYKKNQNIDILPSMIEGFLSHYRFDKANAYLAILASKQGGYLALDIEPNRVIYTRLHDFSISLERDDGIKEVLSLISEYRSRSLLSFDDELFYKGLASLWIYDYNTAKNLFAKITDPRYNEIIFAYEAAIANYSKIQNPPTYYRDGLVSLVLMKHGYFSIAKRLSLRALSLNQKYILPYQVLAYTNFLTNNWEAAKDYFLKLSSFDPQNTRIYTFLIGVSYYWHGDYDHAILYLNQVTDPSLQTDTQRYMLLSYIAHEDESNTTRIFNNMLGQPNLQPSDFMLFFDYMLYTPFRLGIGFDLYKENQHLTEMYINKCSTIFASSQADICAYGEVGLQLAKQNLSGIGSTILSLTKTYHQSHLYHILGDYYITIQNYAGAKDAYLKALSISDTGEEQKNIQNKISLLQ